MTEFYVTGGTLGLESPSYVPRAADEALFQALVAAEFCYVLTSRQMGKSSLMVRVASRLRHANVRVAVIDLTAIGVNVTVEQWYEGLLLRLGDQLGLPDEIEEFTASQAGSGPWQRWSRTLEHVVLPRSDTPLVIFVDEIDLVRSIPFSTDEFFAGIRQFYNRRAEEPAWRKITFCLLGVATPSDLIRDSRMTPFNIGKRIELPDFQPSEVAVLGEGFLCPPARRELLLQRVLHWTGGHPYLTQRLCSAIAAGGTVTDAAGVDRVCEQTFLVPSAREQDDNLVFVRERVLRSEVELTTLLDHYQRVQRRGEWMDDRTPATEALLLAGIVRQERGVLRVRNEIYRRVFDRKWVLAHMPDAELRRQRAAYQQGVWRAASMAAILILILAGAAGLSFYHWQQATEALRLAEAHDAQSRREHRVAMFAAEQAREALRNEATQRRLAETRQLEADELREVAEAERQAAEESSALAVENHRRMQLAYRRLVEQQQATKERGRLFLELPKWLQAYSADAVAKSAQGQVAAGKPLDALMTYAEFCRLAVSDDEGFWVRELVFVEPGRIRELLAETDFLEERIRVAPADIREKVLRPGIQLGESVQGKEGWETARPLLATLYDGESRLLFRHPENEGDVQTRFARIVECYDRAIALDASRASYYVGRAVARFAANATALEATRDDLTTALAQYPAKLEPREPAADVTTAHRDLALIHYCLGNVQQMLAEKMNQDREKCLAKALEHHRLASWLNPQEARYLVALASDYRRGVAGSLSIDQQPIQTAFELLRRAKALDEQFAPTWNEIGECHLALGELAAARAAWEQAVQRGQLNDSTRNRYRYLCNLANAYSREPADWGATLRAAEQAIDLTPKEAADAWYFRGLALWGQARQQQDKQRASDLTSQALQAFDTAMEQQAEHVSATLARCQLLLENADRPLLPEELQQLRAAAQRLAEQTEERQDQAKARYVLGLGWLRTFVDAQDEQTLVAALREFHAATKISPHYRDLVSESFRHAESRGWKDADLRRQALELVTAFRGTR